MTWHARRILVILALLFCATEVSAQQFPEQPPADNPLRANQPDIAAPANEAAPVDPSSVSGSPTAANDAVGDGSSGEEASEDLPFLRDTYTPEQIKAQADALEALEMPAEEKIEAKKALQEAQQATVELRKQLDRIAEGKLRYTTDADIKSEMEKAENGKSRKVYYHSRDWYEQKLAAPIDGPENLNFAQVDLATAETTFLQERATRLEQHANEWSKRAKALEGEPETRKQFIANAPAERQKVQQQLDEVTEALAKLSDATSPLAAARRVALTQQAAKLAAEDEAILEERQAAERGQEVYDLELKLTRRKADAYAEELAAVRAELDKRRQLAADQQADSAEKQVNRNRYFLDQYPDSLGAIATLNKALTEEVKDLLDELNRVTAQRDADQRANAEISTDIKQFEQTFGSRSRLSQASGQLLRDWRGELPRLSQLEGEIAKRHNQKNDIAFREFEASQRLEELSNLDEAVSDTIKNIPPEDRGAAEIVARELLASQVEYLKSYVTNLNNLETELSALIGAKEQLLTSTADAREFIAERDLWIRSARPLWASQIQLGQESSAATWRPFYLKPGIEALWWSFDPENWTQAVVDLRDATYREPLWTAMLLAAFVLLLVYQSQGRQRIRVLATEAEKRNCTEFSPTAETLWYTIVVALPWPLLLWGMGWLLSGPLVQAEFSVGLSEGLRTAAWLLWFSEFLRQACRADGLAGAHLGWSKSSLAQLRRQLRWVSMLMVPLMLWIVGLDVQSTDSEWSASLGRVIYLVTMAYATYFLWQLLMSKWSAVVQSLDRTDRNWLASFHLIWRPAFTAMPVVLSFMALIGYYYTAHQLSQRVLATVCMLMGLVLASGVLRRWVLISKRKLAREQAQKRRAQAQAAAEATAGDELTAAITDVIDDTVDLGALSEATRKLLRMVLVIAGVFGAIAIWQDVFPALAWLDDNPLPGSSSDDTDPMSWGDVLRCLLALVITFIAARDVPSLLELVVLQHLPFDQGARYAIATLARYAILTIGIITAARALSITGTSISWLVAAMGVGLGFGLQEIFANFVSGIILLFERPIRVGDIITLGNTTGVVNRIRMRATTIVDWDRKEFVVPNKDLVTERLLNWTLSDQMNRVVVNVGVAYGTDTDRACELLYEVVEAHPDVLDEPKPVVVFDSFGDSTLNLILRCFLPTLERRGNVIHELHTAIHKRFTEEGIEIAFPQRDVNIRSMPPGWAPPSRSDPSAATLANGADDSPKTNTQSF